MGGALLQLSMRGEQDKHLNMGTNGEKPLISLFNTVYKKHGGFATQTQELFFNSSEFGNRSVCNLLKDADLITGIKICIKLPSLNAKSLLKPVTTCTKNIDIKCFCTSCTAKVTDSIFGWANSIGHLMVKNYSFNVGSKEISKGTGEWLEWWSELAQTAEKKPGYWEMMGKREPPTFKPSTFSDEQDLIFPLNFHFTGKPSHAFPVCAIGDENLSVQIDWRQFSECWVCNDENDRPGFTPIFHASLLVDYVYLDKYEHDIFIKNDHLYLVDQVQHNCNQHFSQSTMLPVTDLNYSQATKSIYWAVQRSDIHERSTADDADFTYGNDHFNYSCYKTRYKNIIKDPFKEGNLSLNGEDRMTPLPAKYYRLVQSYDHHTKTPSNYIYSYCFALYPEDNQPSGTINFSMFHKIKLKLKMCSDYPTDFNVISYALSYNFLIIKERKVSLAFII
mgnify:FL=1|jgi:hypothetical protein